MSNLIGKCNRFGFQRKRQSEMEVAHEIAKGIGISLAFLSDPNLFIPICGHQDPEAKTEHKSQLVLKWHISASGEAKLEVCCVVSVWASVWSRRKSSETKHAGPESKKTKKAARHLVGFPVPALSVSRLRVATLECDEQSDTCLAGNFGGATFTATPESSMRVSGSN